MQRHGDRRVLYDDVEPPSINLTCFGRAAPYHPIIGRDISEPTIIKDKAEVEGLIADGHSSIHNAPQWQLIGKRLLTRATTRSSRALSRTTRIKEVDDRVMMILDMAAWTGLDM